MDYDLYIAYISLAINLMAMFVLLVIIYGNIFETKVEHTKSYRYFFWYCIALFLGSLSEILSYIGDIRLWNSKVLSVITGVSFIGGELITLLFVLYVFEVIHERQSRPQIYRTTSIIICGIAVLVDIYMSATGGYFNYKSGVYVEGPLIQITTIMSLFINIWILIMAIHFAKVLGAHDFIAIIAYIIIPAFGSVVYMLTSVSVEYAAMIMAMLIVFVMIQADIQNRQAIREQHLLIASQTDQMTGLYNRAIHDTDLANLRVIPREFVYITFDLNGLKVTNDTLGHSAGDELIIAASSLINDCFSNYGRAYRIGGDEFSAILDIDEVSLRHTLKKFNEGMEKWNGELCHKLSISYGVASFQEFSHAKKIGLKELQVIADGRMYKCKSDYYAKENV